MRPYAKLRGEIRYTFGTQAAFAQAMGVSLPKLSRLLNKHQEWTCDEILAASRVLNIPPQRIHEYFFLSFGCKISTKHGRTT